MVFPESAVLDVEFQEPYQLADHPNCSSLLDLAETKHRLADWTHEIITGGQVLTELAKKVMRSNVMIKFSLHTLRCHEDVHEMQVNAKGRAIKEGAGGSSIQ